MAKPIPVKRKVKHYTVATMLKIVKKVCAEYSTGLYTLESCCESAGVPGTTWRDWWAKYYAAPENEESKFHCLGEVVTLWEASKKKKDNTVNAELVKLSETMLEKRIKGYAFEVTKTVIKRTIDKDGSEMLIPVGMTKTTKHVHPSDGLIMFILRNLDSKRYGERITVGNLNLDADHYKGRTLEEIEAEIRELDSDGSNATDLI